MNLKKRYRLSSLFLVSLLATLLCALNRGDELLRMGGANLAMQKLSTYLISKNSSVPDSDQLVSPLILNEGLKCYISGRVNLEQGLPAEALRRFRCASEEAPDNPIPQFFLGQALLTVGDRAAAITKFRQIGAAPYFIAQGITRLNAHDIQLGLEIDPSRYAAYYDLGDVFYRRSETSQAIDAYRVAVRLAPEPNAARYWFALGYLAESEKDWNNAIRNYTQALGIDPYYIDTYLRLTTVYGPGLGNYAKAQEWARLLVQRIPNYDFGWVYIGSLYTYAGDFDQAQQWLESVRDKHPDWPDVYYYLGYNASVSGNEELARAYYLEGIRTVGRDAASSLYWTLGLSYRREGMRENAMAAMENAISSYPKNAAWHSILGDVYREAGRREDAESQYQAALALEQDNAQARAGLAALYGK